MSQLTVNNRMSPRFAHHFKVLQVILPQRIYREISNITHDHTVAYTLKTGESYVVGIYTANIIPGVIPQISREHPHIVAQGNTGRTITITDADITRWFGINFGCPPINPCPGRWYGTQSADDLLFGQGTTGTATFAQGAAVGPVVTQTQPVSNYQTGAMYSGFPNAYQSYGTNMGSYNGNYIGV